MEDDDDDVPDTEHMLFLKNAANNKFCRRNDVTDAIECFTSHKDLHRAINSTDNEKKANFVNRHSFSLVDVDDKASLLRSNAIASSSSSNSFACRLDLCTHDLLCGSGSKGDVYRYPEGTTLSDWPSFAFRLDRIDEDSPSGDIPARCRKKDANCHRLRFGPRLFGDDVAFNSVPASRCGRMDVRPVQNARNAHKRVCSMMGLLPKKNDVCLHDPVRGRVVCNNFSSSTRVMGHKPLRLDDPKTAFIPYVAQPEPCPPEVAEMNGGEECEVLRLKKFDLSRDGAGFEDAADGDSLISL